MNGHVNVSIRDVGEKVEAPVSVHLVQEPADGNQLTITLGWKPGDTAGEARVWKAVGELFAEVLDDKQKVRLAQALDIAQTKVRELKKAEGG